ncbi:MAG: hypothetical protein LBE79_09930 [Tannerella sp.]|jgi:hypothetical protein|nr:hypothetical protein [Tannerella sp.]
MNYDLSANIIILDKNQGSFPWFFILPTKAKRSVGAFPEEKNNRQTLFLRKLLVGKKISRIFASRK